MSEVRLVRFMLYQNNDYVYVNPSYVVNVVAYDVPNTASIIQFSGAPTIVVSGSSDSVAAVLAQDVLTHT